ncbi:MAG: type VII secretion integral membrane protein EccD [Corynebacterium sp.]|nr:type VII secretion integral membrane protein EccD [Corynebacterium sp.]
MAPQVSLCDISIPAGLCLADVKDEILNLVSAPPSDSPWIFSTALGQELDYSVPLHDLPLRPGATVVIRPYQLEPHPIIADAAETLSDIPKNISVEGLSLALFVVAGIGAFLLWPPAFVAAGLAVLCFVHSVLFARRAIYGALGSFFLGLSTTLFLLTASFALPLAGLVGSVLGIASLAVGLVRDSRVLGAAISFGLSMALSCAISFVLPGSFSGSMVLAGLIGLSMGPKICAYAAGLSVPLLPSAGEPLPDLEVTSFENSANRAVALTDGLHCGVAAAMMGGLLLPCLFEQDAPAFYWALYPVVAGVCVLHCVRLRTTLSCWALWCVVLMALGSWAYLGRSFEGWVAIVPGVFLGLGLLAPVIASKVPGASPTTVVWIERIESLCLAMALPVCLYSMGLFHMVRGLL